MFEQLYVNKSYILCLYVIQAVCEYEVTYINRIVLIYRPTQNVSHTLIAQSLTETPSTTSFDSTWSSDIVLIVTLQIQWGKFQKEPPCLTWGELSVLWLISQPTAWWHRLCDKIISSCPLSTGFCRPRGDSCLGKPKQPVSRHHRGRWWSSCFYTLPVADV